MHDEPGQAINRDQQPQRQIQAQPAGVIQIDDAAGEEVLKDRAPAGIKKRQAGTDRADRNGGDNVRHLEPADGQPGNGPDQCAAGQPDDDREPKPQTGRYGGPHGHAGKGRKAGDRQVKLAHDNHEGDTQRGHAVGRHMARDTGQIGRRQVARFDQGEGNGDARDQRQQRHDTGHAAGEHSGQYHQDSTPPVRPASNSASRLNPPAPGVTCRPLCMARARSATPCTSSQSLETIITAARAPSARIRA